MTAIDQQLRHHPARLLLHEPRDGESGKLTLTRAQGSLVWDDRGREYIDCTAQAWSNNLGAGDPRVLAAVSHQMQQLTHARATFHTPPLLELAELIVSIAPNDLDRVGFTLHGSMAIEMALKLALRNRPDARHIITLEDAYHGRSIATMAASWPHPGNVFAPLQNGFVRVPRPDAVRPRSGLSPQADAELCLGLLRETITKQLDGSVAAILYEPIQGNGGHNEFVAEWHRGLRLICDEMGILLMVDEVQTGFGRTGRMWGSDTYDIEPDVLIFGKAVGGGFPLAGVLTRSDLARFSPGDDQLTFGQFPVSLAAGVATVHAIMDDDLPARAAERGRQATTRLREMQGRYGIMGDVRCPGLMVAVELVEEGTMVPAPRLSGKVFRRALHRGVIFGESRYGGLGNLLKIKPPLDIEAAQLDRALDVLDDVLAEITDAGLGRAV